MLSSAGCPVCARRLNWCSDGTCGTPNAALARFCRRCGRPLKPAPEWPIPRADAGGSGTSHTALDYDTVVSGNPQTLWMRRTGGGLGQVLMPPVCEHGLLMVCTNQGRLALINRFTGDLLMETALDAAGTEGEYSAFIEGDILVAAGGRSVQGYSLLKAFLGWDGGTFQILPHWKVELPTGAVRRMIGLARFTGTDGRGAFAALVVTGDKAASFVHAIDAATGRSLTDEPFMVAADSTYAVAGEIGSAYLVGVDRKVWRLDLNAGAVQVSRQPLKSEPNLNIGLAWQDGALFFFDTEGALCVCQTYEGSSLNPMRASDHTLQVVKGFSVCPKGILVSCSRGLAMITRNGRRLWIGEGGMDAAGCPPLIAGDVGITAAQNQSLVYYCDIRGASPLYKSIALHCDPVVAAPAYAEGLVYVTSLSGEISCLQVRPS